MSLIFEVFEQFSLENVVFYFGLKLFLFTVWFLIHMFFFSYFKVLFMQSGFFLFLFYFIFVLVLYSFSFLSIAVMYLVSLSILFLFYFNWNLNFSLGNYKMGGIISFIYVNLLEMIEKNMMKVSEFYAILLLEMGVLMSLLNILGMVPFSLSMTSQILFPLFLSLSLFFFNNIMGMCCHGFYLFNLFLPSGVPLFMTPLLLLMEYISYFARIFSLSMRLCANMLSVHILLKMLMGFISVLIFTSMWAHFLLSLMLSIFLLDISTCFLQAYIFVFLSLIYLSNVLILH